MARLPVENRATDISNGLRFGCTCSGNCCRQAGHVYLEDGELERLAEALSLETASFVERFEVALDPVSRKLAIEAKEGVGCPLLVDGLCSVHQVKPIQCSTWPFWPELLDSQQEWTRAKRMCPGLDNGRLYSKKEILSIRFTRDSTDELTKPKRSKNLRSE